MKIEKQKKNGTYIILLRYFYSSNQHGKNKRKTKAHSFSLSLSFVSSLINTTSVFLC